ncbi:MAG: HNH endonuclease family protein [Nitrososphaeraceae archaeon]
MFEIQREYDIEQRPIPLKDFFDYKDNFILRPPYQRKANIWNNKKRLNFLDSLCKHYYVPRIILRQVRIAQNETKWEVIDGQQRITTIILFYENNLRLPETLQSIDSGGLFGKIYKELSGKHRQWFDKNLFLEADIIKNIDDPRNAEHLKKASEIFWRLQQGEPLTFMETLHSRLHSSVRNFVTKYADDMSYDFKEYKIIEHNRHQHQFFAKVVDMKNDRMQLLALLTRMLMIEFANGPTELKDQKVEEFIDSHPVPNGNIFDESFENNDKVKGLIKLLNIFYEIFKDDTMITDKNGVKELVREYFILSLYLLLRHLTNYYVFTKEQYGIFKEFVIHFHKRWRERKIDDMDITIFRDNRQQSKENLETRDMIIRNIFFTEHRSMTLKDNKRTFNESDRIMIYRRDRGLCKQCLEENKNEKEATVSWNDYDADHIKAWFHGGETKIYQGQVLCRYHNRQKGAQLSVM